MPTPTHAFNSHKRLAMLNPMHDADGAAKSIREQPTANRPVMVDEWAEAVIDLGRAQSRRRHPSNREPVWAKDGGYESTESAH
jgi:hypothetical protein